jgi:hypothetical protein
MAMLVSVAVSSCGFEQPESSGTVSGYTRSFSAVTVFDLHGQVQGNAIADADGGFSIELNKLLPQVLKIRATGGEYYSPGDEFPTRLGDNYAVYALINYVNDRNNKTRVDFSTTVTAALAEYQINSGKKADMAVVDSSAAVGDWFDISTSFVERVPAIDSGSGVREYSAADVEVISGMEELTELAKLVVLNASLSGLANRINTESGAGADALIAEHQIIDDFYKDVLYDGKLNGVASGEMVSHSGLILTESHYRHEYALAIIDLLQGEDNYTDISSLDAAQWIVSINEYYPNLFGDVEAILIPEDRPYLEFSGLSASEAATGLEQINYRVADFNGVESISLFIDQQELPMPLDANSFVLDTSPYKNEIYKVKLVARNTVGAVTEIEQDILFSNQIDENYTLRPDGELVSGEIELNVQLGSLFGIARVEFYIDGAKVFETEGIEQSITYSVDTATFPSGDGEHVFRANIISNSGNVTYKSTTFNTDNTGPVITWDLENDVLLQTIQQFTAKVEEDQALKSVQMLYDGIELRNFEGVTGEQEFDLNLTIDTRTIFEGSHVMSIEAVSLAGILAREQRDVYVDWNNPTVNIITPSGTKLLKGANLDVSFQALDTNGIGNIEYFIDDVSGGTLAVDSDSFQIANPTGLVQDRIVKVEATDLAGRKSADSILVRYQVLSINPPTMQLLDSGRARLTYNVFGVESAVFSPVFTLTDPDQALNYTSDITISQSYNPATEVGTVVVDFPGAAYPGGLTCGTNWELMDYTLSIRYRGQESNIISGTSSVNGLKAYIHRPSTGCSGDSNAPLE